MKCVISVDCEEAFLHKMYFSGSYSRLVSLDDSND